jgi:predicted nucleic acid-binding protein
MDKLLLDSNIRIDHLRGYAPARQYLKCFEAEEVQGYLSIITVGELAAGQMRQEEEETKIQQWLAMFTPPAVLIAICVTQTWLCLYTAGNSEAVKSNDQL